MAAPQAAVDLVVEDQHVRTIDVADVLSDRRFEWSGWPDFSPFVRNVAVRIVVRDSSDIVIDVGDVVSDNVFLWTADQRGRGRAAWRRRARLALRIPVEILVERSHNVRVNAEDLFGDNVAVWSQGDVGVRDIEGNSASDLMGVRNPAAPKQPLSRSARSVGPLFSVRMPVSIRVSDSESVTVDIEDIFGDNVIVWASGDADVSNLVSRLQRGIAAPRAPDPGGALEVNIPVSIVVEDSTATTVDVEDIAGDDVIATSGGDVRVSNLRGSPAADLDRPGRPQVDRGADVNVPVTIRVRRSTEVVVDIEDIVGDEVVSWSDGTADISNLTAAAPYPVLASRLVVRAPLRVDIIDARRVELDIEDIMGDDVLSRSSGSAQISNLAATTPPRSRASASVLAAKPVVLRVAGSRDIRIDIEDIGGDVVMASTPQDVQVSNLRRGPGRRSRGVADRKQLWLWAPVRLDVARSRRVDIDIEDIVGDNDVRLLAPDGNRAAALIGTSLRVAVRGGRKVIIDVATVASGNDVVLCAPGGRRSTLDDPGVFFARCGALAFKADVRKGVSNDASAVDITIGRVFGGNTLSSPNSPPGAVRAPQAMAAPAAPAPRYLGAHPARPGGFRIDVQPGPRLAADPAALAAVRRASQQWERFITDPVTVTVAVELADDLPAGVLAQAHSPDTLMDYRAARAALVADARDELALAEDLGDEATLALPAVLRATVPDGVRLTGSVALTSANAKALGFEDPNGDQPDAGIELAAPGSYDLEGAAAHEIGHALGFLSVVDDVNSGAGRISPTTLDLYRFAAGGPADPRTIAEFGSFPRNYVPGVDAQLDFVDQAHAVATGEHTGHYADTDGDQARHWKRVDQPRSRASAMKPAMDGGADHFTIGCADLRAMDMIGYDVATCLGNMRAD